MPSLHRLRLYVCLCALTICSIVLMAVGCRTSTPPPTPTPPTPLTSEGAVAPKAALWDGTRMLSEAEAANYLGDRACARCHEGICDRYAGTRHARTLTQVTEQSHGDMFRNGQKVHDPVLNYTYRAAVENGVCVIRGESGGRSAALPADFAFGSGRNAITFLSRERPDAWVDLRISYYTARKRWDFTPMQKPGDRLFERAAGIVQAGERLVACLQCHVTYLRADPFGAPDIQRSHLGIGCERCHGPGREHVETVERAAKGERVPHFAIENLRTASPERINQICGICHRTEENAKPGEFKTENGLARFQGAALVRSRCYQISKTLSCISCHDPHADSDPRPDANNALCLKCHQTPVPKPPSPDSPNFAQSGKVCRVNPKSGCIECHMPHQTIATIPHAQYRNHWIKVWERSQRR
jgi:hypothetical protein